jgi:demethylmenaquinone methyltransferase/2-methoxy-6-polyprenyl-1,4-benzoquinol methylase
LGLCAKLAPWKVRTVEGEDEVLAAQVDYYRHRAPEYDAWFRREGSYDHGPELSEAWRREAEEAAAALTSLPLDGADVLELAPGTGLWTERYIDRVASVTAVDAAPEMIELARARLGERAAKVDFVLDDIFGWTPTRRYDAVVFCFWISHVPVARLDAFLRMVASALRPDGRVFFVDGLPEPTSGRADLPNRRSDGELQQRRLDDGREFRVVKNYWPADELAARFAAARLDADIRHTARYFQYGIARLRPPNR